MRRSLLFLPGNSPGMIANGPVLPADSLILDLEDAVAPQQKDAARNLVRHALRALDFEDREIIIRINATTTDDWLKDLAAIVPAHPHIIMPPKIETPAQIEELADRLSQLEQKHGLAADRIQILPLLESARGVENAFAIASASPRVVGLFLGAEDLTADLQCERTRSGDEIYYARTRLVNAARAARIEAYDTPFTDTDDLEGLAADAEFARGLGFSGKSAISPRHLRIINQTFSPSEDEIAYAQAVILAIEEGKKQGKGAVSLRGKMIDAPIVMRAQHVLEMARQIGLSDSPLT